MASETTKEQGDTKVLSPFRKLARYCFPSGWRKDKNSDKRQKWDVVIRRASVENNITQLYNTPIMYSDDRVIGKGVWSIVYEGYYGSLSRKACIKRVAAENVEISRDELDFWRNNSGKCSGSENIADLYDLVEWLEGEHRLFYYFAMELGVCNFSQRVKQYGAVAEANKDQCDTHKSRIVDFLRDIAKGIQWLHSNQMIHRRIKPENVLICRGNAGNEVAKLGDLGIAAKLPGYSIGTNSVGEGPADWMAPETINAFLVREDLKEQSTPKMDIFSLGMVFHFGLSFGKHPFRSSDKYGIMKALNIHDPSVSPVPLPEKDYTGSHLLRWMMQKEKAKRPSISQVLEHPLFWSANRHLQFLTSINKVLCNGANEDSSMVRNRIDSAYRQSYEGLHEGRAFDWNEIVGNEFSALLTRAETPKILLTQESNSVSSLINYISSVYCESENRCGDLERDVLSETFSKRIFSLFPEMLIFLYYVFSKENSTCVLPMHQEFYKYGTVPAICPVLSGIGYVIRHY